MAAEFEDLGRRQGWPPVELVNVGMYTVPAPLQPLAELLLRAQPSVVMGLEGTLDPGEAVDEGTWKRAAKFVLRAAIRYWTTHQSIPPLPMISADGDKGIDIVWRTASRSLYLNIPEEPRNVVTFYGRDQENPDLRLRGEEDIERNGEWILGWLAVG